MVLGPRRSPPPAEGPAATDPRSALERVLLRALRRSPCVVAFSGGRDSSAILAAATRVARSHGLEDPVPHTLRFGDAPRAAEGEWQEMVVRHLGLESWSRREVSDELDALGPIALDVLRRHGVHWPPNVHTFELLLEPAAGGALLTGNGGDELFYPWAGHRVALMRRGRTVPRRYDVRPLMRAFLPGPLLFQWALRRPRFSLPWLTPAAARDLARSFATQKMPLARTWLEELEKYLGSRYLELGPPLTRRLADDAGVDLVEPFFEASYVRAVGHDSPREGYGSRTAVMQRYFGDLLPPEVAARPTKAVFTELFSGPETRRFAREWDGTGLGADMVDAEALRGEWLSPVPDVRSLVPLQAAWLASA